MTAGPDIQFTNPVPSKSAAPEADLILRYLVGINLVDQERNFRATLWTLKANSKAPRIRDLVIATVVSLLEMGAVDSSATNVIKAHLIELPDEYIKDGAVAVVNGAFLLIPGPETLWLGLQTLQPVPPERRPLAFVSTIYSLATIWDRAQQLLG